MNRVGPGSSGQARNVGESCADGVPGHPLAEARVVTYRGNYSAFNGYRFSPSDYSLVRCASCGTPWRTKAAYVDGLPGSG